jgi:uncharacterized protein (DUF1501 family)
MGNGKPKSPQQRSGVSRRDFLRVGGLSVVSLSVAERAAQARKQVSTGERNCIFVLMTGGPSQFETFDPKPAAPADIRGPLRAISTSIPGTQFSESLPRLAAQADKFAILRSLNHDAAPIHETGLQLLQTGRLARGSVQHPSFGSVVARFMGPRDGIAPYVAIPRLLGNTGVNAYRGQQAGFLGNPFDPLTEAAVDGDRSGKSASFLPGGFLRDEPAATRLAYGNTHFGRLCLQARKLIECGVRCVTVNLFDTLAGQATWDCHGRFSSASADLYDYRDRLCPEFDRALSALFDDLQQRGMLDDTLVIAVGEFGRTPRVNEQGGRDHWPGVWSALIGGGGVQGGRVIGASDAHATAPSERPIAPGELTATIYDRLGLGADLKLYAQDETELPLVDHQPIQELFA